MKQFATFSLCFPIHFPFLILFCCFFVFLSSHVPKSSSFSLEEITLSLKRLTARIVDLASVTATVSGSLPFRYYSKSWAKKLWRETQKCWKFYALHQKTHQHWCCKLIFGSGKTSFFRSWLAMFLILLLSSIKGYFCDSPYGIIARFTWPN